MSEPCDKVSLKEYVEALMEGHDAALSARLNAMDRALAHADKELERRLGELNQLRHEVTMDRNQLLQHAVFDQSQKEQTVWRETSVARITEAETRITKVETRAITWSIAIGVFWALLVLGITILLHYLK